jgi:hypothetical protein
MIEKTIFPREEKAEVLFDKAIRGHITSFFRHSAIIYSAMMILERKFRH